MYLSNLIMEMEGQYILTNQLISLFLCNFVFCYTSENTFVLHYLFIHFIFRMLRCLLNYQSLFTEIKIMFYDGCQVA